MSKTVSTFGKPSPFRFHSGEEAADLGALLTVCQQRKAKAARHLAEGHFEQWLRDLGHRELAGHAATLRASNRQPEAALDEFRTPGLSEILCQGTKEVYARSLGQVQGQAALEQEREVVQRLLPAFDR